MTDQPEDTGDTVYPSTATGAEIHTLSDTALVAYRRGFNHRSAGGKRSGNPYTDAANKSEWLRGFKAAEPPRPRRASR